MFVCFTGFFKGVWTCFIVFSEGVFSKLILLVDRGLFKCFLIGITRVYSVSSRVSLDFLQAFSRLSMESFLSAF